MSAKNKLHTEPVLEDKTSVGRGVESFLVLHNDDVHTFDYVIESLIEVCRHDTVQAEQCTYIVHFKGKCDVMKGSPDYLMPHKEGLALRGLTVTIE